MDYRTRQKRFDKIFLRILRMLGSSVVYLYRHMNLFAVALVTGSFASMQVWYDGAYNNAVAVLLAFSRLWLFGLIVTTLTGHSLRNVSKRAYWKEVYGRARWRIERLGLYRLFLETIFLVVIVISFGNFIVIQMSVLAVMILPVSESGAFSVIRLLLSNVSVIPIVIIYVMMMLGADQPVYARKVPR